MKKLLMICALLIIFPDYVFAASTKQNTEIDRAADQAWIYYQEKKYKEARDIVSKYYIKEHVSLALLTGVLYATENKCNDALDAIHYVSSYYDEKGVDIFGGKPNATESERKKEDDTKKAYQGLKKIGFICHMKLGQWQETMHDAKIFLQFQPDDLMALVALGSSARQLAQINLTTAEKAFEQVSKLSGKNGGDGMQDNGKEDLSASDYAGFNLALIYSQEGQHEKAVKAASQLLKTAKNPQKILNGMKGSPDYNSILNDKEMTAIIKSLGL